MNESFWPKRQALSVMTSQVFRAGILLPCALDLVATPPGIALPPRLASLLLHRVFRATRGPRRATASRFCRANSRGRTSNILRRAEALFPKVPVRLHGSRLDVDHSDSPALLPESPLLRRPACSAECKS